MTPLIDTHAHISGGEYDADRDEMLQRAREAGVCAVIDFGDSLAASQRAAKLAAGATMVYAGVGVHPNEAVALTAADLDSLAELAAQPKVVAIGEIGLDYHWEKDADRRAVQRRTFAAQLDLARQLDLPVCIHDRDAHGDTLAMLKREGRGNRGAIHCYSGSWEMARELLALGWHLGLDGPITYSNARKALELVRRLPLDRLLLETDSPYLTPMPLRGRRNEPAHLRLTANFAAATTANARALYALPALPSTTRSPRDYN